MDTNYFVCTLGEAENGAGGRPYRNVNDLIRQQSQSNPSLPAVGFYRISGGSSNATYDPEIFTFEQVYQGVVITASRLTKQLDTQLLKNQNVGLLSASSPEFFFTWLACVWLGHSVLLVAPECSPSGIAELCKHSDVSLLLVDEKNEQLGRKAAEHDIEGNAEKLECVLQPFHGNDVFEEIRKLPEEVLPSADVHDSDIAYMHHTSGTSSGTPKPIPQSHRGAVGALPALEGRKQATFTTTPLFHGGPADTFRAWTSNAMIWLFPSKDVPITAANVMRCLECSGGAVQKGTSAPVKYFASVPYVLEMMANDPTGLSRLQHMELVGVGGAALPRELGEILVKQNVNLVSRFGSAECGFMLSSHRDYANDHGWQYLRLNEKSSHLKFEPRDDGLSELVVLSGWPFMAKKNREDGSYATSDLFKPHTEIKNAWKYDSRADSQLTLVTGKKFDPAPVEEAVSTSTELLVGSLVFVGQDQSYPGILLFRSREAESFSDSELVNAVAPSVEKVNAESLEHARIPQSMLVPMAYAESPLDKSSKGTVLRRKAEEKYASCIQGAYKEDDAETTSHVPDEQLRETIKATIQTELATDQDVKPTADLFSIGVDSIASIKIRRKLQRLLPPETSQLPVSVVEDCGSIDILAQYIKKLRHGNLDVDEASDGEQHDYMLKLVEQYSQFTGPPDQSQKGQTSHGRRGSHAETIVLTGATGALGAHVLDRLRNNASISKIYCLVRGADAHAAHERVNKALHQRQLGTLNGASGGKITVLPAKLHEQKLGLGDEIYERLSQESTRIMHLAWSVNFRLKLRSFEKDSIAGIQNIINLALASKQPECADIVFCSSVASVMAYQAHSIPERILKDPSTATNTGYSQSKWVAEHICNAASQRPRLRGKISIYRVGQLSGDSTTGVWNANEAWPLMLSTVKVTQSLPDIRDEVVDWLPVDVAAVSMVEGTLSEPSDESIRVIHVVNNNQKPTWDDLLQWLGKRVDFEVVPASEWIKALESLSERDSSHPALRLLEHWAKSLPKDDSEKQKPEALTRFEMERTKKAISTLRDVTPVEEEYFGKLWDWINGNM